MIKFELNPVIGKRFGEGWIRSAERAINRVLKIKKDYLVSVALLSPARMRAFNRRYRGKDKPTDVLSFTTIELKNQKGVNLLGEIFISPAVAASGAKAASHSTVREMQYLLAHGVLHLLGYRHARNAESKKMFNLQDKILKNI
ncbi:MAG: rRNA maturation RNase YbeY [Patescibacteria group bacterium]|nr:rRNA maturation RNase YbeY [Patescibacteria group bacterium]